MRKILVALLLLMLAVSIFGCKKGVDVSEDLDAKSQEEQEPEVSLEIEDESAIAEPSDKAVPQQKIAPAKTPATTEPADAIDTSYIEVSDEDLDVTGMDDFEDDFSDLDELLS